MQGKPCERLDFALTRRVIIFRSFWYVFNVTIYPVNGTMSLKRYPGVKPAIPKTLVVLAVFILLLKEVFRISIKITL